MTNQIIQVPDISVVETVGSTKQLFSLRDQKVKKEALQSFGVGSGIKYNEDLYVLDSGIIPIVRMTTTKIDPSFTVERVGDIEVDWGDGTREVNVFSHTYTDGAMSYEIVFYGNNTTLTKLWCYENQLTQLDVSQSIALDLLMCQINQLIQLDVSQNMALKYLYCEENQLAQLNVGQNTTLTKLWCYENQLTLLDVSQSTGLRALNCLNNQLAQLDVSQNIALTDLGCSNNQLIQLDVSQNTALESLYCEENQLTQIDITKNTALRILHCSNNQLTQLNVSQNIALIEILCQYNQLAQLDVSQNIELNNFYCLDNPFLVNEINVVALANSLPQRSSTEKGQLYIRDNEAIIWIQSICDEKNWTVS